MKIVSGKGFTLIELMIAVAVIGILAAIALPSYNSQIRKSRRTDAVTTLSAFQQAQERWRVNFATYAALSDLTALTTATPPGFGMSATSSNGYYTITIGSPTGTRYTLTATAVAGTSQAADTNCNVLVVTVVNGSGTNTPASCWSK